MDKFHIGHTHTFLVRSINMFFSLVRIHSHTSAHSMFKLENVNPILGTLFLAPIWTHHDSMPTKYEDFGIMLEKMNMDRLLEHRPHDCLINLQEVTCPPFCPLMESLKLILMGTLRRFSFNNLVKKKNKHHFVHQEEG